jgi:hypothetical protein
MIHCQGAEQVRDFLITKLKDAEYAIKNTMSEVIACQNQSVKDHEV